MRLLLEFFLLIAVVILAADRVYPFLSYPPENHTVGIKQTSSSSNSTTNLSVRELTQPFCSLDPVRRDDNHVLIEINKTSKVYQAGDSLNTITSIAEITAEGIVLSYHPFEQFISFKQLPNAQQTETDPALNIAFPYSEDVSILSEKNIPPQLRPYINVVADNRMTIKRQFINKLLASRDELKNIRFAASSKGGFQATSVAMDSSFAALGLKTGDIIKSVNNTDLSSLSDVMSVYRNMNTANTLQVRLERQGLEQYLFYQFVD